MCGTAMRDLRVGTLGRITAGEETGRVVEVVDDAANTGGFLIFTYADFDRSPEVFDSWAKSIVEVEQYFDSSGWEIEWPELPGGVATPSLPIGTRHDGRDWGNMCAGVESRRHCR